MKILSLIWLVLSGFPTIVFAQKVNLNGADRFQLSAEYQAPDKQSNRGVLMLHQCNADKTMYADLQKSLKENGFHSLALDFRGYGESVDTTFSLANMRKKAANQQAYFSKVRKMRSEHWETDVVAAYQYLSEKTDGHNISFIGASCGGVQSIKLANKYKPESFTFFSSGMNENIMDEFSGLSDIPALIIAAVEDEYTFKSSNQIFLNAKNKHTRLISYKGRGHGVPLFKQDPDLEKVMVNWFKLHSH